MGNCDGESIEATHGRPRILLLHGLQSGSSIWGPLRRELADGAETAAPDLLGYGHNRRNGHGSYTLERIAEDLEPLIASFAPTHVVGHSMGGIVALALSIRQPDAFVRIGIAGLPIYRDRADAMAYLGRRGLGISHRLLLARHDISHFGCEAMYRGRNLWAFTSTFWVPRQPREHVIAAFNHSRDSHFHSLETIAFAGHVPRLADAVRTPVAALHGGRDAAAPLERVRALAMDHGWDFRVAPTGSHQMVVERPALTARWVRRHVIGAGVAQPPPGLPVPRPPSRSDEGVAVD